MGSASKQAGRHSRFRGGCWVSLVAKLSLLVALPLSAVRAQDVEAGRTKAAACAACHGADGNSPSPLFPILAGQNARYLYLQLRDMKEGRREVPVMASLLPGLQRADMLDLAAYFAAQKPRPTGFQADAEKARRGKLKADETLCAMCHLGAFKGQNEIPRVAGQHHAYVLKQLQDFREGRRTNDAGNMSSVSKTLNPQDMDDLAHYIAGLD